MAPEQIETPDSVDHRADLYSLGVVLYELLTGELPIGRFDPPSSKSGCSQQLDDLVMRTLEKDPNQRFQQASMIGSAVRDLESAIDQSSAKTPLVEAITQSELTGTFGRDLNEPLVEPISFSISNIMSNLSSIVKVYFAKAHGLLHAFEDRLEMEYRINDPIYVAEDKLRVESIQLDDLASVQI